MDAGNGHFKESKVTEYDRMTKETPLNNGMFRTGQLVELNGSLFKIQGIRPRKLILKLVKRQ